MVMSKCHTESIDPGFAVATLSRDSMVSVLSVPTRDLSAQYIKGE